MRETAKNWIYSPARNALALGILLTAMSGAVQAAPCPLETIDLHLPDDEDSKTWSATHSEEELRDDFGAVADDAGVPDAPNIVTKECFVISGSGPLEVEITLEGPAGPPELIELLVNDVRGNPYREVLLENSSLFFEIKFALKRELLEQLASPEGFRLGPEVLKITVKRLKSTCAMSAVVTGDVNGYYFGDVAWFLADKDGVVMDPELAGALGDLNDLAAGMIDAAHEMGYNIPPPPPPSADEPTFEEAIARELKKDQAKGPRVWGSQFVLGLHDMKHEQGDLAALSAISGFSMAVGATPKEYAHVDDPEPEVVTYAQIHAVGLTLGILAADQVVFELPPGRTELVSFIPFNDDFIVGAFDVDLVTKGKYTIPGIADGRQLKVHVKANFAALRGQTTCAHPW